MRWILLLCCLEHDQNVRAVMLVKYLVFWRRAWFLEDLWFLWWLKVVVVEKAGTGKKGIFILFFRVHFPNTIHLILLIEQNWDVHMSEYYCFKRKINTISNWKMDRFTYIDVLTWIFGVHYVKAFPTFAPKICSMAPWHSVILSSWDFNRTKSPTLVSCN